MGHCALCGGSKNRSDLIKGKNGAICSLCADVATDYFSDQVTSLLALKTQKSLTQLKAELDRMVIGQEVAKRQLLMELYKHSRGNQGYKNNAFLIGDSGVGKTHLVRSLAKLFDVKLVEFDATMFSETGYKGKDVMDIVEEAYQQCGEDMEVLKQAVIFVDEIDKIITTTNSNGVTKIQQSLLKIVEGMEIVVKKQGSSVRRAESVVIDTKELQFIVAGACVGLDEAIRHKRSPKHIGFGSVHALKADDESTLVVDADDLIDYGFIPEFVGRFPLILTLNKLTKEDYINILINSERSLLKDYIHVFDQENIILEIENEVVEYMAEQVQDNKLGFRGVQSQMTKRLNDLLFDSIELERDRIVLNTNNLIKADNLNL